MAIQWYPRHMNKARKEIAAILPTVDMIIEVLDARIPYSSENPVIADLGHNKPVLKVLSKLDLADPERVQQWQEYFEQQENVKTLAYSSEEGSQRKNIIRLCKKMTNSEKTQIQILIAGIPNVGKSTLINKLTGRTIAKTGNEPAVTKGQQRIKLDQQLDLIDTPGMLWPNIENEDSGFRLAATGGIKETAYEVIDIAFYCAEYLLIAYPDLLMQRFNLDELPERDHEFFDAIGKARGCIRAGGKVDLERICRIFLTELRSGKIGRITFETPQMREQELIIVEQARAEKAEKKALRLEEHKKKKSRTRKNRR